MSKRGFDSDDFRECSARAIGERASTPTGLPERIIDLLEGWLRPWSAPDGIASRHRRPNDEEKKTEHARSILWSDLGFHIVPHGNYPALRAITRGLLLRQPIPTERWLAVLAKHLQTAEDPDVWKYLAITELRNLKLCNASTAAQFVDALLRRMPEILECQPGVALLAFAQSWTPADAMHKWLDALADGKADCAAQGYGELLVFRLTMHPSDSWVTERIEACLTIGESVGGMALRRLGIAHSAAYLWSEAKHRATATDLIVRLVPHADVHIANAILDVFRRNDTLIADVYTKRIIDMLCTTPVLRLAERHTFLVDRLIDLFPDHADQIYKICSIIVDRYGAAIGNMATAISADAEAMVQIALSLQRLEGLHRIGGLELFERLLELDVQYAQGALVSLDRRPIDQRAYVVSAPRRRKPRSRPNVVQQN